MFITGTVVSMGMHPFCPFSRAAAYKRAVETTRVRGQWEVERQLEHPQSGGAPTPEAWLLSCTGGAVATVHGRRRRDNGSAPIDTQYYLGIGDECAHKDRSILSGRWPCTPANENYCKRHFCAVKSCRLPARSHCATAEITGVERPTSSSDSKVRLQPIVLS